MQALSCGDREVPIPDIDFTISSQSYSSVCRNLPDHQSPTFSKRVKLDSSFPNSPKKVLSSKKTVIDSKQSDGKINVKVNLQQSCIKAGIAYIQPCADETQKQQKNRRRNMIKLIGLYTHR